MSAATEYRESSADRRVEAVPLAHLSIELGHFYCEDLSRGIDFFESHFRRIAPWAEAARLSLAESIGKKQPRISTCVLIDDYFERPESPRQLIPMLQQAARRGGLEIDYLVRESGCAAPNIGTDMEGGRTSLAALVEARLVQDPPPSTTAMRPPVGQTGWLCNGERSPATGRRTAMKKPTPWRPPTQNAANRHSVFVDIELWNTEANGRRWSCAMLAGVWQLLRLGVLRNNGLAVAVPQVLPEVPDEWQQVPTVVRLNDNAKPFNAYRTLTICSPLFLPIEHAVRTILEQVAVDPAVLDQIDARSSRENFVLPRTVVDRIEYVFVNTGPVRGAGPR